MNQMAFHQNVYGYLIVTPNYRVIRANILLHIPILVSFYSLSYKYC